MKPTIKDYFEDVKGKKQIEMTTDMTKNRRRILHKQSLCNWNWIVLSKLSRQFSTNDQIKEAKGHLVLFCVILPAVNQVHRDDRCWLPCPSHSKGLVHNGSSCHIGDCTWPNRSAWCGDRWPHTMICDSDWFPWPGWPRSWLFQRCPGVWRATPHCDSIGQFCRCVPCWCRHSKRCTLDSGYQFLFCNIRNYSNQFKIIGNISKGLTEIFPTKKYNQIRYDTRKKNLCPFLFLIILLWRKSLY